MKKSIGIIVLAMVLLLAGCGANEQANNNIENEMIANQEKFLHDGDTYTAELFFDMVETYDGILSGDGQQTYVFDLRNKEDYKMGHISGAINLDLETADASEIIEKTPSDWTVYVVGKTDEEAKKFAAKIKAADEEPIFVYAIEGGYEALEKVEGIEKYITIEPGDFSDFSRTQAAKEFDEIVEKGIIKEAE